MTLIKDKKKFFSYSLLIIFGVFVGLAVLFSEVFQTPVKNSIEIAQNVKLFKLNYLDQFSKITLKNKSGEFVFEKNNDNQISPWKMISPRQITASSIFIDKLYSSLTSANVKKIYSPDQINMINFSLTKPTATLLLTDSNNKTLEISIGLLNTIDHSTYIKLNDRQGIYHIDAPTVPLENATLLDLIESKIITIDQDSILSFKIFQGRKAGKAFVEMTKEGTIWKNNNGEAIPPQKLDDYLQDLAGLKSSFILDELTDTQKRQISNLTKKPEYTLSIDDNKQNTIDYNISSPFKELSGIDLKNESYFLITISNNSTAYIVKKQFFDLFEIKPDKFKP
jgi:hypothetical protein